MVLFQINNNCWHHKLIQVRMSTIIIILLLQFVRKYTFSLRFLIIWVKFRRNKESVEIGLEFSQSITRCIFNVISNEN